MARDCGCRHGHLLSYVPCCLFNKIFTGGGASRQPAAGRILKEFRQGHSYDTNNWWTASSSHHLINIQSSSRLAARHSCNNTRAQNKSFARSLAERRTSPTYVIPVSRSCRTLSKTKHCYLLSIAKAFIHTFQPFLTVERVIYQIFEQSWSEIRFIARKPRPCGSLKRWGCINLFQDTKLSCILKENTRRKTECRPATHSEGITLSFL